MAIRPHFILGTRCRASVAVRLRLSQSVRNGAGLLRHRGVSDPSREFSPTFTIICRRGAHNRNKEFQILQRLRYASAPYPPSLALFWGIPLVAHFCFHFPRIFSFLSSHFSSVLPCSCGNRHVERRAFGADRVETFSLHDAYEITPIAICASIRIHFSLSSVASLKEFPRMR